MVDDWTDALSADQARTGLRIERDLRHQAERWARLEAQQCIRLEAELDALRERLGEL